MFFRLLLVLIITGHASYSLAENCSQKKFDSTLEYIVCLEEKVASLETCCSGKIPEFPSTAVVAFSAKECPDGWEEFPLAYGRFIRGIDKGNSNIDPDGVRAVGSIQEDALENHVHGSNYAGKPGGKTHGVAHEYARDRGDLRTAAKTSGPEGAKVTNETRPKNVALLYCIKN